VAESLERLESFDWIESIVVVAPVGWEEPVILLTEEIGAGKVSACVPGGKTRADSVRAGVSEIPEDAAVIVVHDAARPLLAPEIVERVLAPLAEGWDGAVPGLPLADTVKRVDGEHAVVETVERYGLYAVQTPQAFVAETLRRSMVGESKAATDCASFVEAAGGRIRVVEGDPRLIKVTSVADLALVESLLAGAEVLHAGRGDTPRSRET
jgi:2-C-methyl-D-erythritol 4-phosphate cytidylyltransferase